MPVPIDCKAGNWEQFLAAAQNGSDQRLSRRLNGACVNAFAVSAMKRANERGPVGAGRDLPDVLRKHIFDFMPLELQAAAHRGAAHFHRIRREAKQKAVDAIISHVEEVLASTANRLGAGNAFSEATLARIAGEALGTGTAKLGGKSHRWHSDDQLIQSLEELGYRATTNTENDRLDVKFILKAKVILRRNPRWG